MTPRLARVLAGLALLSISGSLATAAGTVTAGAVAYAGLPQKGINVEPSMRPWRNPEIVNPDSWWDPARGPGLEATEIPLLQRLHPAVVRIEFPWWAIERTARGQFDWSRADASISGLVGAGLSPAPVIVYSPDWSSTLPNPATSCTSSSGARTRPAQPPSGKDFGDFVRAAAGRYRGQVHYWEMWNEPDLPQYFSGTPDQYAQDVLVPGFQAVKQADPTAQVIFGGPSYANMGWLGAVLNSPAAAQSFDIIAFHNYGDTASDLDGARKLALVAGGRPIWLGEWGAQDVSGSTQTPLINSILGQASAIAMAVWYALRDDSAEASPGQICKTAGWGLTRGPNNPPAYQLKSSFATFQAFNNPPPPPATTIPPASPGSGTPTGGASEGPQGAVASPSPRTLPLDDGSNGGLAVGAAVLLLLVAVVGVALARWRKVGPFSR